MDLGLAGKTAVVTGGSRGIGKGIVDAFVEEGMTVLAVARESDALDDLGAHPSGQVHTFAADLSDPLQAPAVADYALRLFDNVDVLVNNAGGSRRGPFADLSYADWTWHLDMNITATALVTQAFADHFIGKNSGKVINIASTTAIRGSPTWWPTAPSRARSCSSPGRSRSSGRHIGCRSTRSGRAPSRPAPRTASLRARPMRWPSG